MERYEQVERPFARTCGRCGDRGADRLHLPRHLYPCLLYTSHTFIFECTRNKLLIDINRKIERSLITFRNKTFTIPNNVQNFIPAHRAIVNAFEAGSPEMAEFCMKAHMEAVAADYDFSKEVIPEPRAI